MAGDDISKFSEIVDKAIQTAFQSTPKFSTVSPEDYRTTRSVFADRYGLNVSDVTYRVNTLAAQWFKDKGSWPSASEMIGWDAANNAIASVALGYTTLGPSFGIRDDTGDTTYYYNDPVFGSMPTDAAPDFELLRTGVPSARTSNVYNAKDLQTILAQQRSPRGGSGSGRAGRAFDKRQLSEALTNRWRGLLLEEPDDSTVSKIVNDYISQANSFWIREAGNLDFDTFIVDKIRTTQRHSDLYRRKPESQSEDEYMSGFQQTAQRFGMNTSATLREVEAGARSGAGLAGFSERVGNTREARLATDGGFSRQIANQMQQMGGLG